MLAKSFPDILETFSTILSYFFVSFVSLDHSSLSSFVYFSDEA